jgi:hypothetical protein
MMMTIAVPSYFPIEAKRFSDFPIYNHDPPTFAPDTPTLLPQSVLAHAKTKDASESIDKYLYKQDTSKRCSRAQHVFDQELQRKLVNLLVMDSKPRRSLTRNHHH